MKRKGTVSIVAGLLLIAAALGLTVYNLWDAGRAAAAANTVLEQMEQVAPEAGIPAYMRNPNMAMPVQTIDGHDYVGVLTIPALHLSLPVQSEWSYANLQVSPCRYSGSAYLNDLVLAAHNYDGHFGKLKNLHLGDEVQFRDMAGNVFSYEVGEITTLHPTAVEEMTAGEWDLTLFTCTLGGRSRVTVRCELVR